MVVERGTKSPLSVQQGRDLMIKMKAYGLGVLGKQSLAKFLIPNSSNSSTLLQRLVLYTQGTHSYTGVYRDAQTWKGALGVHNVAIGQVGKVEKPHEASFALH